ncbi:MAG: hypothetical protein AAF206_23520 [Bacteroidota bacterium]
MSTILFAWLILSFAYWVLKRFGAQQHYLIANRFLLVVIASAFLLEPIHFLYTWVMDHPSGVWEEYILVRRSQSPILLITLIAKVAFLLMAPFNFLAKIRNQKSIQTLLFLCVGAIIFPSIYAQTGLYPGWHISYQIHPILGLTYRSLFFWSACGLLLGGVIVKFRLLPELRKK